MFARFFIDRPIFASVLSILIVIVGGLAYYQLPLALYPNIVPPIIQVTATYPGADAEILAQVVALPLEERINGVENMIYMETNCMNTGSMNISITFEAGTDVDDALVLVQNRVSLATPKLPEVVKQTGVTVKKRMSGSLLHINFTSPSGIYDSVYISNFLWLKVRDAIIRVPGVGDLNMLGEKSYSMRVWLDPGKLMARGLTAKDVSNAIEEQNIQVAAGRIGQPPVDEPVVFQYTLRTKGQLKSENEFGNIVVNVDKTGRVTRLKDVARLQLSAKSIDSTNTLNGQPAVSLSIFPLPEANALQTAANIRSKMKQLERTFPPGLKWEIAYDTTPYIEESIQEVKKTLRDAVILVALVVLLFLQSWRAAIIPLLAVPISLIGTCTMMYVLGFSLNTLSLFGLVLAIGIVVDDAIVVVENIEHHMEQGLSPREAAHKAMDEVSGALIAIALVLSAVFIPAACVSGILGMFFREFALTIAVSTLISAFVSLTLSPALSAILLRPKGKAKDPLTFIIDWTVGWIFPVFNYFFKISTSLYVGIVRQILRISLIVLIVYGGLLYLTWKTFNEVPTGFIPTQDKGYLSAHVQLPDSASLFRTREMMRKIYNIVLNTEGVANIVTNEGYSSVTQFTGSNVGSLFIVLEPYEKRNRTGRSDIVIQKELLEKVNALRDGTVRIFRAPPVIGLGLGGFKVHVQDLGGNELPFLQKAADDVVNAASETSELFGLQNTFRASTPQLYLNVDRMKAKTMNVPLSEIFSALQICLGSLYVNDLSYLGRNYEVKVQADAPFRSRPEQIYKIHVRNSFGEMVPLGSLLTINDASGPLMLKRFNMYSAATITGQPVQGVSSGKAMQIMERILEDQLPSSMGYEWTELSLLEKKAGNTAIFIFSLAVLLVFLLLAALYESWSLPFAVILVVPMCLLCSLYGVLIAHLDMNIFTQIGFIVLVGLASKNAILIVEFAKTKKAAGASGKEATLEACRLRLRPIIMTSFAFILGVVPLMVGKGAGYEMRQTLGIAVFSGMLGVTLFGIFLTPVFYYVIQMFGKKKKTGSKAG
ncbi:MAG: multidrug efflux RND transporter permease subunit [Planctomycetia bacterium]|nr:multidrug efflux RND transporter permease subunit [Planctomycetia bacterium]